MVRSKSIKHIAPLVSVLMPAYNAQQFIDESIESILKQTYKNIELIIIDDCSTDQTWDVIQRFVKKSKRVKAFRNKKNLYIAANRNKLISLARGKYIAWQDADDISLPTRIEKQCNFLEEHPEVGIVGGYLQFFNNKGKTSIRKYAKDDRVLRKKIFRQSPVAQPAAMIRRVCFQEFGDYNLQYPPAEDLDMSFRIGIKYRFANLPETVIFYRESIGSATYRRVRFILATTIAIRQKYWYAKAYSPTLVDTLYNLLQRSLYYLLPAPFIIPLFNFIRNTKE